MPTISVIVPVYKAEAFLRKCTDSILRQSFQDLELLLIDDGSPDRSGALCDAIAGEDSRVRVFHKPNGGVSSARNLGLGEAQGTYIAFVDSDDYLEPKALELLLTALQDSGADSAGCGHFNVSDAGVTSSEAPALPAGVHDAADIRENLVLRLLGDRLRQPVLNGFIWRFLYTRAIIADRGIEFEGAYLEDELFLMEYFCHAKRLAIVAEPLYNYYWNAASATHRYMRDYPETFRRFMERKEALAGRYGLDAPLWRENSNYAGLLIAVGNEYAPGNPASFAEKQRRVAALAALPEMQRALAALRPEGAGRNKQIVAALLRRRWYALLTLLYRVKNRGK
ncbi:MAG: glycosyltransferase [Oscillospiraceae bacterium]|jgi:glycosyltransferase EpsJ|nr:glycosyltransferase [Oscillospiraceae bacterium]